MVQKELPEIIFNEGYTIHSFEIKNITKLSDTRCIAYEMIHTKSSARLIYLQTDDTENLFSVAFRTFPKDNTGLPHILEHTVLCGSKRYPVKDPFVELLKTSLATFLNAMTYPDKTVYPCASTNEEDFHNILRVYCDAVFNPLITKEHFKQEGHHFNLVQDGKGKTKLTVEGVVYNEMKGVYSDLDGIISREESKSIMPKTIYGKDSGGNPPEIPSLTYRSFKSFHSKYYHPANSYMIVYGSFDIKKTLKIINEEFLDRFETINLNLTMPPQPRWSKPVRKTVPYPISHDEKSDLKSAAVLNFLTNPLTDTLTSLAMSVIEMYLLDNASSPLRKALIDSKLGEALTSSGYGDFQHDTFFTVGLKGINPKSSSEIEKLIISTCKEEAQRGFHKVKVDAAFHKLFLDSKEIQSAYPLTIMDRVYDYWLYDADPLAMLKINDHLYRLKELVETQKNYLENILNDQIVNNNHYSVMTYVPDNKYQVKLDKKFEDEMKELKSKMSKETLLKIKTEAKDLEELQSKPNSPEALKTLPRLSLSKIDKKGISCVVAIKNLPNSTILTSDVFSNSISYVNLAFDVSALPEELFNSMALFKSIFLKMGTKKHSYTQMAELEASYTGGIASGLISDGNFNNMESYKPCVTVYSKCLDENFDRMLSILNESITECEFSNQKRLKELILQKRTNLKSGILSSGSSYAVMYASKCLNQNMYLSEATNGITHLRYLNKIADNFEAEKSSLIDDLYRIKGLLLKSKHSWASFVGDNSFEKKLQGWIETLISADAQSSKSFSSSINPSKSNSSHGIAMSSSVSYNSTIFKTIEASNIYAPAIFLIAHYLTYNYLWDEIRVKRGSYGANSSYSMLNGTFAFSTYRDPCIKESYDTFKKALELVCSEKIGREQLELAIIGSLKKLDRPIRPEDAVGVSLNRNIRNITNEFRDNFRTSLLSLTPDKVKAAANSVLKNIDNNLFSCTISGKKQLDKANAEMSPKLIIETV